MFGVELGQVEVCLLGFPAYPAWDRQVSVRDGLEYKNELTNPLFLPPRNDSTGHSVLGLLEHSLRSN